MTPIKDRLARALLPLSQATFLLLALALLACPQTPPSASSPRNAFTQRLVAASIARTYHTIRYDPAYIRIPYPNGDVPADSGVCTGEIIRIYRAVGIDLQKEVHEDMEANFSSYPNQRL